MAQNKESLPASTLGDTLGKTTVILKLFDTAAAALCAYDQENNGQGKVLLLRDRFPRSVNSSTRAQMLKISSIIHGLVKAQCVFSWQKWYNTPHKTLDDCLAAAKSYINNPPPNQGRISLSTHRIFWDRAVNSAELANLPPQPKNE